MGGAEDGGNGASISPSVEATERNGPGIVAKLRGMAVGAAVPLAKLSAANAAVELPQAVGGVGRTSAAVITAGTADGHVLVAHDEDAAAGWDDFAYLIKAQATGGTAFVAVAYAGLLLHPGENGSGLACVDKAIYGRDVHPGIPTLFPYRRILAETTIEGAIRVGIEPNRAFGNNHLLANADGGVYDVEASGRCWALLDGGNRFLAHAKRFTSDELRPLDTDEDRLNSCPRYGRVERLIDRGRGKLTVEPLRGVFGNHSNGPRSFCAHHGAEGVFADCTIASGVIDATSRALCGCAGYPWRVAWREVRLSWEVQSLPSLDGIGLWRRMGWPERGGSGRRPNAPIGGACVAHRAERGRSRRLKPGATAVHCR